jgi:hypothetical protein
MYIGSYRVERMLGTGSFATVWLAHDERLDAPVAIKVLADNWARHPEIRRRFIDEARLLRRLDDEHVVAVYSIDELPDDRPYFVMGWATAASSGVGPPSGPPPVASLWLKRCRSPSTSPRAWPWSTPSGSSTAMSSPATCCSALCRFTDVSRSAPSGCSSETSAGAGVGRHQHPADLYATGAVLYELLAGRPAYDTATLGPAPTGRPPPPPLGRIRTDVPSELEAVIDRARSVDPAGRFATAPQMAAALRQAVQGASPAAGPHVRGADDATIPPIRAASPSPRPRFEVPSGHPSSERTTLTSAVTTLVAEAEVGRADLAERWREVRVLLSWRLRVLIVGAFRKSSTAWSSLTTGDVDAVAGELLPWPDANLVVLTAERLPRVPVPPPPARIGRPGTRGRGGCSARRRAPAAEWRNAPGREADGGSGSFGGGGGVGRRPGGSLGSSTLQDEAAGLADSTHDRDGRTARQVASDGSARWRGLVNAGRIPFAARASAETVARAYDRMTPTP